MTGGSYLHCYTRNRYAIDASNKGFGLGSLRADANSTGLASYSAVANIDIVTSCREVYASITPNGDIRGACVVKERLETFGRVIEAGAVEKKRISPLAVLFPPVVLLFSA